MTKARFFSLHFTFLLFASCIASLAPQLGAGQGSSASEPGFQERHPRYVLQRSDVVMLTFPLSPELNQTATIQPDGFINLQNAGSVYAQGLTAPELAVAVQKAY